MNWKCDGDPDCENNEDEPEDCQDTSVHECDATYFRCNNNRCIPGRWRCDHDDDCGDNSDETACLNLFRNCSESEKTCSDGMCIHEDKFCDGKQDCKDKTDELFCDLECSEDEFRCRSPPYCIFQRWKCDGDRDCSDGSDEKDCPKSECPLGEFTCVDSGSCIGTQWICDGEDDCGDNSDEASELCHQRSCEPGRYRCDNSQCILWSSVCDTVQDCSDGSDESAKACQTTGACNDPKSFRCANGKCIEKSFVCDDIDSCGDNSDEVDCDNPPCNFGACSQDCEVKHHSPKSQSVNTKRNITTASCSCVEGYALEAKKTCKALGTNATLLLANENTLRMIYPYAYHRMVDLHPEHAVARSKSPKIESVDVFYDDQVPIAVWSVKEERVIYYQKMGPGQQRSKRLAASTTGILVDDVDQPRGLAVDWLSMNLYFIDGLKKSIQLVKIEDTKMRKTIATSLDQPQDIAVDPQSGRLFFSDYGMNAKIYVANLDGSDLRSFIEAKVLWPSSLAIDYPNGRLYWTDLKARTIDSVALDGSLRKLVRKFHPKEGRPNKLDVFENFVYFSTYQHNKILKMNKFGRGNMTEIAEEITRVSDIVIMQENKAKVFKANMVDNPCKANGLCSHMPHSFCVLHPVHNDSAVTSKCICSDGFEDNSNGACIGSKRPEEAVVKGDCDDIDCNRGVCKIGSTDGKAKCDCIDPMYNGEFCDHYICAGYCFNGGMCFPNWIPADTSKPPQIMCSCRKGFEGKRCEIRTTTNNDCSTMCANNATCTIEANGEAKCHCLPGFSGDRCDQCGSSQVCENGGQCRPDTNGIVRCSCAAGFHGPFCQFRQCDRYGPCQNEGSCIVSSLEGPKCECPPTFTGKFCDVYVCENYCKHGGTPTGRLLDGHYRCSCDCPPGISGERCEKDSCSTLQCFHGGTCHVLDGHELCNCTLDYTGIRCTAAILTNPCADVKCQNGGICQAVKSSEAKTQYHPKCVCSKHRAGLECERPNLCLDRCLNDGKCVSTLEGSVSCICPPGLAGTRCERKSRPQGPSSDDNRHVDTEEVNSTVITIMSIMLSIVAVIGLVGGLVYLYRKKRLGAAFKHRRMAENLVGNNMEFPNQMFLPEEDEAGGHNIPMSESTNFANPVYETMYGGGEAAASEANGGHHHQEEEGLLASDPDQIDAQSVNDHDSESVDLLTEKHRGNISL
jgi:low-density lipoprotein receptor-related protein 1 (alpha-2-macroglobulin receptor)